MCLFDYVNGIMKGSFSAELATAGYERQWLDKRFHGQGYSGSGELLFAAVSGETLTTFAKENKG